MKMGKFIVARKLIITTLLVFFTTAMSWAEITGSGTALDPYVLNSDDDWDVVTKDEETYWGSSVYIKLGADITAVNAFIGYKDKSGVIHSYKGHFDGDWHTLTFDLGSPAPYYNEDYAAPFSYVDGAKISNLTVDGMITTTAQYAGTIVGYVSNTSSSATELTSCTSECFITCYREGRAYHGGMIGRVANGDVIFKWCIFNGTIIGEETSDCAGFVGYVNGKGDDGKGSVSYRYCTMAYANITLARNFATFNILGNGIESVFDEHTYYTRHYENDGQGIQAPTREPDDYIARKYTFEDSKGKPVNYYVPEAVMEELDTRVVYGGTIKPDITYYGKKLVINTDFDADADGGTLKIQGKNKYAGSIIVTGLNIVDISTWANLKTELYKEANKDKEKIFVLTRNLSDNTSAGPIKMRTSGEVTLDLNGYTLNRGLYNGNNNDAAVTNGHVIEVETSAVATIIGPGIVTGGNNKDHGGGIKCKGRLTLKDVNVSGNCSIDRGGGVYMDGTSSNCYIEGCVIDHNWSTSGGGGVYSGGSKFKMKDVRIEYNQAHSKGGALRLSSSSANITDCCFDNNTLLEHDAADGGGVWSEGTGHTFTRCTFTNNNAFRWGGAYYMIGGGATFKDCDIQHNSSLTSGGGIYVNDGTCVLDGTKILRNSSNSTGGVHLQKTNSYLQVKGETIINMNNGDATKMNLFVNTNSKISITGDLTRDAFISLSRNTAGIITDGLNKYAGDISNFRSDNYKMYWLRIADGEVSLQSSLYWNTPSNWGEFIIKKDNDYIIKAPIIVSKDVVASANSITYVEPGIIFIEEGGQLKYTASSVPVSVLKNINAASKEGDESYSKADTFGWYGIATPVKGLKLSGDEATTNIITAQSAPYNFDLLCYDEPQHLWQSYTDPLNTATYFPGDTLMPGRGYLYRTAKTESSKTFGIEFTGKLHPGDVEYELSYTEKIGSEENPLAGFNLIGNPYTHRITKGKNKAIPNDDLLATGFYSIEFDGSLKAQTDGATIKPCQGIFVKALKKGTLTMKNIALSKEEEDGDVRYGNDEIKFTITNSKYEDATYAVFEKGVGLDKIGHNNPDIQMIYINQDGEDYAVATMGDNTKQFNLNFKAKTTGRYTLSCETKGEFDYLHVIDRLTGQDVDMLLDGEYSFIGSPKDTDARFVVRLQYKPNYSGGDGNFAYFDGNDIVVYGEGELQVFDVMGRMVAAKNVSGDMETINVNTQGVYILRLNDRTQKIVVR